MAIICIVSMIMIVGCRTPMEEETGPLELNTVYVDDLKDYEITKLVILKNQFNNFGNLYFFGGGLDYSELDNQFVGAGDFLNINLSNVSNFAISEGIYEMDFSDSEFLLNGGQYAEFYNASTFECFCISVMNGICNVTSLEDDEYSLEFLVKTFDGRIVTAHFQGVPTFIVR